MKLDHHAVANLTPLVSNPRTITPKNVARLRGSIQKYGLFKPLLVWKGEDDKMYVIGGNQRHAVLTAMSEAGELPMDVVLSSGEKATVSADKIGCIQFHGTEAEARAVALRDNNQDGEWDWDTLPGYVDSLIKEFEDDTDLSALTGFDEAMLSDLSDLATAADVDLDRFTGEPDPPEPDPDTDSGSQKKREEGKFVTRQHARFSVGNVRGNIPIKTYNRWVEWFNGFSGKLNTTDIPTIIEAMLDELEA